MDSREALIALNMLAQVGPVRVRQLLEVLSDAAAILGARRDQLLRARGIGKEIADSILKWESTVDLTAELQRIKDYGCEVLIQSDELYPPLLREIYDPPLVLYVKG